MSDCIGTFQLHSNQISSQRSHIIVIIIILPLPRPMTLSSLAPSLRTTTNWILTKDVLFPDFPERCAKLLDTESVNNRVDSRVAMGENDGNVNEEHWLVAGRAEERNAVEDVKREPTDCEEE